MAAEIPTGEWNQLVDTLIEISQAFSSQYFDVRDRSFRMKLPGIALEDMRVDSLSHSYQIESGDDEFIIGLNSKWTHRPLWELCESLAHEMVHIYQETHPSLPKLSNWRNHTQIFADVAAGLGLQVERHSGRHYAPANGIFKEVMDQFRINVPEYADRDIFEGVKKGFWWDNDRKGEVIAKSTMILYMSDKCVLDPACKVRSGISSLKISCDTCGGHFSPVTNNSRDNNPERFKFKAISADL